MTQNTDGLYETKADALGSPTAARQYWLDAIDASSHEEKDWRETADKTWKIYSGTTKASFNILHANVETTVPAIYNSVPIPDCRPRYGDKNEVARKAAQVLERALSYGADEYDEDEQLEKTVRDAEISGRGVDWVEFEPTITKRPGPVDSQTGLPGPDVEQVGWAAVRCVFVPWSRFRRGPGTTWPQVPWAARQKFLSRDELITLCGPEIGQEVQLDATENGEIEDKKDRSKREKTVWKCAMAWEIWDRDTRKVWYVAPGYDKGPIAVEDDPLGLKDFLPTPRPMQFLVKESESLTPIVPYSLYSAQAEELNTISDRLLKLIQVAKYRGVRASDIKELDDFDSLDDGQFMPSKEAMALLQNGGALSNAIWVMPLGELTALIRELVIQRESIKQVIYEITGIADIMRGASNAQETLGAQQLKAQWGSLRVQIRQKEVQRYCRDLFRLKAEIIAEKFPPEVLSMIAGEPLAPEVVELLQTDVLRRFMVDIETDSTIQADRARDQRTMTEFLSAAGQFMQLSVGAVQAGIPPELPLVIFQSFASKFKLGKQVDDVLAKMIEGAQPVMAQKQQQEAEAKAKRDEAEQIGKAGMIADVKKKQGEAEGQQIENQGKAIENQRQMVTPIETAAPKPEAGGFVQ